MSRVDQMAGDPARPLPYQFFHSQSLPYSGIRLLHVFRFESQGTDSHLREPLVLRVTELASAKPCRGKDVNLN